MVEPRHQPINPTGRYSGVKEPLVRNWDRNKARIESIYQLPTRDFRQTAAQFGIPPSMADLTTTENGIPKMECTTTTKSDFCPPSLDRYVTVPGVCPDRDYPSSSGLEYCPGREPDNKPPPKPASTPVMPRTRSTCPASSSSLSPNNGPIPKLNYPTSQFYPKCSDADDYSPTATYSQNTTPGPIDLAYKSPDYTPKVDYFSKQPGFKWPVPVDSSNLYSPHAKQEDNRSLETNINRSPERLPRPDFSGGGESIRPQLTDYPVETEEHAEKRRLHDATMEMARREYDRMIGSPGSTAPLVKGGIDPPKAVAHYNVPDYTQGTPAGGIVRPRFGAPGLEMNVPVTDPSYPKPEYRVPPPEAGLTRMTYSGINADTDGKPGVAYTPPVRYPNPVYSTPGHTEPVNPEVPRQPYIPSMTAAPENEGKCAPTNQAVLSPQTYTDTPQPNVEANTPKTEISLKGVRRIQTTNQVYGSWIDDPYLKDNDWWFKAKTRMPIQKTYLSKYKEESGWQ